MNVHKHSIQSKSLLGPGDIHFRDQETISHPPISGTRQHLHREPQKNSLVSHWCFSWFYREFLTLKLFFFPTHPLTLPMEHSSNSDLFISTCGSLLFPKKQVFLSKIAMSTNTLYNPNLCWSHSATRPSPPFWEAPLYYFRYSVRYHGSSPNFWKHLQAANK
jgi:hypothetical protein